MRNIDIDVENKIIMDYITTGIINETKYILWLNTKYDYNVIKLLMTKGNDIKTIKLNRDDILKKNFRDLQDESSRIVLIYLYEYAKKYDIERGFRLIEISYAKVFQKREGGCNQKANEKEKYKCIEVLNKLIGMEL